MTLFTCAAKGAIGAAAALGVLVAASALSDAAEKPPAPIETLDATTGNFVLSKGRFRPLEDVLGAAVTAHVESNNRGETAGFYLGADDAVHGFRRDRHGAIRTIDVPGALLTVIYDINDRGQMVGIYVDAGAAPGPNGLFPLGTQHAFVWSKGVVTVVDPPDTVYAPNAYGINNKGQIVGVSVDADLKQHGYLLEHGTYTPIEPPGSAENKAFGINDHGQVVGIYLEAGVLPGPDGLYAPGTVHGYVWDRKDGYATIDVPGSRGTFATKVNNRGQVVGEYKDADGGRRGFVMRKRTFTPIDGPGDRPSTIATDINDRGDIVIPSPGTVGLLDVVA